MHRLVLALVAAAVGITVSADEGMWTFDNVPRAEVRQKYGVELSDEWLSRLQQRVVRLEGGCTGSFVSPNGLVLTNHHCVQSCLAENSSAARDLVANGHLAGSTAEEIRCQNQQVSVLVDSEDITARLAEAVSGLAAAEAYTRRQEELTRLEQSCEERSEAAGTPLKCESVTLYQGGQYWLYKYKRYSDVRLVFSPEDGIAAFGGDPDNFQFPRWCLDMSLLRVYEQDRPAATPSHLRVHWNGAAAGEPVFVAGHPGSTDRLLTTHELDTLRDVFLPFWLIRASELRGRLIQYAKSSPEAARTAQDYLDSLENSLKVRRMQLAALLDDERMAKRAAEEAALQKAVHADPALDARAGEAWTAIAEAQRTYRRILVPYVFLEQGAGFNSDLFQYARQIVRAAEERTKPNAQRLREYTEAELPQLRQALAAESPVYPGLEEVRLSFSLERMREWLGPDDPVVRQILGTETPDQVASRLVTGSTLGDPRVRLSRYEGGREAVASSTDPMIVLARTVDDRARALRKRFEDEVEAPVERAHQAIAAARFAVYGTSLYPDATFTLRLSHGAVKGWREGDLDVDPFTRLGRLYERATGTPPFALPRRWLDAKPELDMATLVNFVTTNDIVGGNSGSPMVNARGDIVGLVFDGNIHSIAGSYWFDEATNRTVAVHPQYMRAALTTVYPAGWIAEELGVPGATH